METHSSILAWRIPQTVSLVGYNPWGPKELDPTRSHWSWRRAAPDFQGTVTVDAQAA